MNKENYIKRYGLNETVSYITYAISKLYQDKKLYTMVGAIKDFHLKNIQKKYLTKDLIANLFISTDEISDEKIKEELRQSNSINEFILNISKEDFGLENEEGYSLKEFQNYIYEYLSKVSFQNMEHIDIESIYDLEELYDFIIFNSQIVFNNGIKMKEKEVNIKTQLTVDNLYKIKINDTEFMNVTFKDTIEYEKEKYDFYDLLQILVLIYSRMTNPIESQNPNVNFELMIAVLSRITLYSVEDINSFNGSKFIDEFTSKFNVSLDEEDFFLSKKERIDLIEKQEKAISNIYIHPFAKFLFEKIINVNNLSKRIFVNSFGEEELNPNTFFINKSKEGFYIGTEVHNIVEAINMFNKAIEQGESIVIVREKIGFKYKSKNGIMKNYQETYAFSLFEEGCFSLSKEELESSYTNQLETGEKVLIEEGIIYKEIYLSSED